MTEPEHMGRMDLIRENARLRELYEDVAEARERFGWTINHLLECNEAWRCAKAEAERLREAGEAVIAAFTTGTLPPHQRHALVQMANAIRLACDEDGQR